jgi:hypothetical protein
MKRGVWFAIAMISVCGCGVGSEAPAVASARSALTLGTCGANPLTVATATASSEQNNGFFSAAKAIDGDPSTRWPSNRGMPQWLLDGAGAPVMGAFDGATGMVTMSFTVSTNPGPNPMIDLNLSGAFAGFCPGCNGGEGIAAYTVGASLVRTH